MANSGKSFRYLKGLPVKPLKTKGSRRTILSAHNLKVTGSNPVPATKILRIIKDFKAEQNARILSFKILVNAWSTFYEAPLKTSSLTFRAQTRSSKILETSAPVPDAGQRLTGKLQDVVPKSDLNLWRLAGG